MVDDLLNEFFVIFSDFLNLFMESYYLKVIFCSMVILVGISFIVRFVSHILSSSNESDTLVRTYEDFVRCEFFRQHRCPYGLKDFNYDWCRKYCQMGIYDDEDEYEEED